MVYTVYAKAGKGTFMNTYVVAATIDNRSENSPAFQAALSEFGCQILGRFGIPIPDCDHGLVNFVLHSDEEAVRAMKSNLEAIPGTTIEYMRVMENQK